MFDEWIIRLVTLGIPFLIGLFVPQKSKSQIDDETQDALDKKFGKKNGR